MGDTPGAPLDSIYGYTTLTGTSGNPVLLGNIPGGSSGSGSGFNYGNGLATDPFRNRLLFVRDGAGGGSPAGALWALNMANVGTATNPFQYLGIINTPQITVNGTSGGGSFYNGAYYYWDDNYAGNGGLIRVGFNGAGAIASTTTVLQADRGDFGDIAISNSGIMYAVSVIGGDRVFWSLDLNVTGATPVNIRTDSGSTPVPYLQIAFNNSGALIGAEVSGTDTWYSINLGTGAATNAGSRPGGFGDVFDLGTGGLYMVPEPGVLALMSVVGLGMVWFARRKVGARTPAVAPEETCVHG